MRYFKKIVAIVLVSLFCLVGFTPDALAVSQDQLNAINQQWKGSVHALNDVNCKSCHQEKKTKELVNKPGPDSCKSCHKDEVGTFLLGKHGIRTLEGQSSATPDRARIAMKSAAHSKAMNCNACHNVHSVKTVPAAVDSCLTCHNDQHSLNYEKSKHAQLFREKAASLPRPDRASVTCATCHLPRQLKDEDDPDTVFVNHNNTYNLLPRDRMVKDVCMNCHGMEYSYNNIFDDENVAANFDHASSQELKTLEMMRAAEKARGGKRRRSRKREVKTEEADSAAAE